VSAASTTPAARTRVAELAAQRTDRDPDGVGERVRVLVPHLLQQCLRADHVATRREQLFEHPELLRRQVQQASAALHRTPRRVEHDAGGA
jgi:hypothetical protein